MEQKDNINPDHYKNQTSLELKSDYENAFKIACALLNGDSLYGIDSNTIFSEIMKRDGCICSVDYEDYILTHLNTLMYGEEKDG